MSHLGLKSALLAAALLAALGVAGCSKKECAGARKAFYQALMDNATAGLDDGEAKAAIDQELAKKGPPSDDELAKLFQLAVAGNRPGEPMSKTVLDRKAAYDKACR